MNQDEKGLNFKPALVELSLKKAKLSADTVGDSGLKDRTSASTSKTAPADHCVPESLLQSDRLFRTVFEAAPFGIAIADPDGYFIEANRAFHQLLGYDPQEVRQLTFVDITHPEDRPETVRLSLQARNGAMSAYEVEKRYLKKNGDFLWAVVRATAIRDQQGKLQCWIGIIEDVTERKKAKEALEESDKRYRDILDSIKDEEKERKRLESQVRHAQKMEAIGTLAGGIAHDFNNLLMGFQGNISLMMMDLEDDHPHQEFLHNMENYVKRGSELTRQILGFARGGKYEVKTTDINALIDKSAAMFGRTKKEIIIHKKLQEDLWSVNVDRGQIEQVLLNLFVNAWQAMPAGGNLFLQTDFVILEEQDHDKPYTIGPGKYVRISVSDTGVGMDKATRERIFEPFFTTKAVGRGTGLGLASAYGIIKNHGGIINVYSEKGHGATFKIYLPASGKQLIREKIRHETVLTGSEMILLVDDEEMVADIGKDMLEKLGYKTVVATGGNEAIKMLKTLRHAVDLVILDLIMPDMSGGETFNRLKAIKPDIKILLSSGYSLNGQASEIMQRGCNGFIQKPFNLKQISRKIREILDA
jgi:two-component system cell cycle sensor histidine kinase/response regulator CckA